MALSRAELVDQAVEGYFGSVMRRDIGRIAELLADECVMRVVSAGITYDGKQAILEHFEDFLGSYHKVTVSDFQPQADAELQQAAVRFTITLHGESQPITMTNCNFFTFDAQGHFTEVAIYMSDLPEKGF